VAGGVGALTLVTDANIWIQLEDGGLTEAAFALGCGVTAPDDIVGELGPVLGRKVVALGLRVLSTGEELETDWQALRRRYPRPGDVDLYGLLHARLLTCRLVTGDRHLREAAEAEGVEVSGLLWLLDRMVEQSIVTRAAARRGLRAIRGRGARLPEDECERRMLEWGEKPPTAAGR
jgi:hypothetical protein